MKTNHKIIHGDSRSMAEIADESVHLVITSPPYWQLKDYGTDTQIGFNDSYEQYINHMNLVWKECHRVLQKGCRLCVNIGDQFARSIYYGRYKVIPIRTEIIKFCESVGFDYMGAIIWQKVTTTNTSGGATIMGSFPHPRNGILKLDYEFILLFKKSGKPAKVAKEVKEQSKMTTEEWNTYFAGHWNFSGEKQSKHLAMFPEELPRRLIKMFSFVDDTVLDPFLGSGTTSLAAKNLNRHSIGYEINQDFLPIIEEKLGATQQAMFDDAEIEMIEQKKNAVSFEKEIQHLPYIFKDPVSFDKKIDLKKKQFGSKIDGAEVKREKYFTVKEVLSSELVKLSDGSIIRLLGVNATSEKSEAAMQFLRDKTRGQKVYLRFDGLERDEEGYRYGYLYLFNKTFLNAHLIKKGLADVDDSIEYKHKARFLTMLN